MLNLTVDLFKERVVEFQSHKGWPGEGFNDQEAKYEHAHICVIIEPAKNHETENVNKKAHQKRKAANHEHEVSWALVWWLCEGNRLVSVGGEYDLKINWDAES